MTDSDFPASDDISEVEHDVCRLTGIRDEYTLASTPGQGNETDKLMINLAPEIGAGLRRVAKDPSPK